MYLSPAYQSWIKEADQLFLIQKRGPVKTLTGHFFALLELHTTDKRRRKDGDNRWKAPLDFATRLGLIEDDQFMQWGMVGWIDEPEYAPPYGARLTIWPFKKEGLPDMLTALTAKFGQYASGEKQGSSNA